MRRVLALATLAAVTFAAAADDPATPDPVPLHSFAKVTISAEKGDQVQWRVTPRPVRLEVLDGGTVFLSGPPGARYECHYVRVNFETKVFKTGVIPVEFAKAPPPKPAPPAPKPPAPKPPAPPADPLVAKLRAAYLADPGADKAERLAERAELYAQAAKVAADESLATVGQVLETVRGASLKLAPDSLKGVRAAIAAELAAVFPDDDVLDAACRARLTAAFARVAAALRAAGE